MGFKPHHPASPLLIGYDPVVELPGDHLARFVDQVVDAVEAPAESSVLGQNAYAPQMLAKVLLFAYSTGTFSSRRISQNCVEHLAYLFLTRGERPCFKTICTARIIWKDYLERIWLSLLATASAEGVKFLGKVAVDATRIKANTSRDSVLAAKDFEATLEQFRELLARADRADEDDEEGLAVRTQTGVDVSRITVRQVVRSVGKDLPDGDLTSRGKRRMEECVQTLETAIKDGSKYVSLSDPDARMMPLGSRKVIGMGHGLEVAVDSGMIVGGGTTNQANDAGRLHTLVDEALVNDPVAVTGVVADSGYFKADDVVALQAKGLEVVVPDSTTANKMRRHDFSSNGEIHFERVEGRDAYRCPQGHILLKVDSQPNGSAKYRTAKECTGCPLAHLCLQKPGNKRRSISVRSHAEAMSSYLASFAEAFMQRLYYARGPSVETVFAFMRRVLGFTQWSVRGAQNIAAEGELLKCSYQIRKIQSARLQKA